MIKENNLPLVTVFTLCYYTKAKFVIDAIESIYNQTYKNIEHIIINDAPDDRTEWPTIKNYIINNNLSSVIIENKINQGINENLNTVLDLNRGEYIIGCSDDVLEENAVERLTDHFNKVNLDVKIVFGDVSIINENNQIIIDSYLKSKGRCPYSVNFSSYLQNKSRFPTLGCMYKSDVFETIGNYDISLIAEDVDMHLRILSKFNSSYCNCIVGSYRRHSSQLSNSSTSWFEHDRLVIFRKWIDIVNKNDKLYIKKTIESFALNSLLNRKFDYKNYSYYNIPIIRFYNFLNYFPVLFKIRLLLRSILLKLKMILGTFFSLLFSQSGTYKF
jgi:alpha-1,3-rhamnosyltransferase